MFLIDDSEVIEAKYFVTIAAPYTLHEGLQIIATEESIGIESVTFEDKIRIFPGITTATSDTVERVSARFIIEEEISEKSAIVCFRFPVRNLQQPFGIVSILLSTFIGDLFGLEAVETIRLLQIKWPKNYRTHFPGPKFGLSAILGKLQKDPPLLGAIIKPNIGLSPRETAALARRLALGGVDFVKDDELQSSLDENSILERTSRVRDALDSVALQTGRTCLYAVNITADCERLEGLAQRVIRAGANCLMINIFAAGFQAVKMLAASPSITVPIHTHRCMHDVFTSREHYGVAPNVFAELGRLCGADFYHIGTPNGKTNNPLLEMRNVQHSLLTEVADLRQTVPVSSRASALSIASALDSLGDKRVMFLACGAIYKPPGEIAHNVGAIRAAIDLATTGRSSGVEDYDRACQYLESLRWPRKGANDVT